jgi:hypothetical protein
MVSDVDSPITIGPCVTIDRNVILPIGEENLPPGHASRAHQYHDQEHCTPEAVHTIKFLIEQSQ